MGKLDEFKRCGMRDAKLGVQGDGKNVYGFRLVRDDRMRQRTILNPRLAMQNSEICINMFGFLMDVGCRLKAVGCSLLTLLFSYFRELCKSRGIVNCQFGQRLAV